MLTDEQRKERLQFIGSSDAAAALGLSRWKTPLWLWGEKVGIIQDETSSDQLNIWLGNELEDVVARRFTHETGKVVRRVKSAIRSKDYPFLGANVDRLVVGEDAGLECKTASGWKAKEWAGEEIPQEYIIQCYHCMAVTGKRRWYIAVLIGNEDFIWREVAWDDEIIQQMIKREVAFWNDFVLTKTPPNIVTAKDTEALAKLYPTAYGNAIDLNDEVVRIIENRNAMIQDVKHLEAEIEKAQNEIKALLKDNESGRAGKWLVTWKNQKQKRLDTERIKTEAPELYYKFATETEFRKFAIRELKQ